MISLPGLDLLQAETNGDSRICVAIIDGPIDQSHPCFQGANLSRIETVISSEAGTGPASRHGTHVASIIFGQHGGPVYGIAPACRGLSIPVFADSSEESETFCSQLDLARAITQAVQHGAHVINISGGQLTSSQDADELLAGAVRLCADNGVLIVSAAGNDGCECLHIPAALPSVLVVGAMDSQGSPIAFSNWGKVYQTRGILAPGERILGALPGGGVAERTGTKSDHSRLAQKSTF